MNRVRSWPVQQDRPDEAKSVLERARPDADMDTKAEDIRGSTAQRRTGLRELFGPRLRPFLIVGVGVVLAFFQQAVGISAVIYFAVTVLKFVGHSTNADVYETISVR